MTENDITADWAVAKRDELGLSQTEFWGPGGVIKSAGSRYETGAEIPVPVRRLMWLHYEIGMPVTGFVPADSFKEGDEVISLHHGAGVVELIWDPEIENMDRPVDVRFDDGFHYYTMDGKTHIEAKNRDLFKRKK